MHWCSVTEFASYVSRKQPVIRVVSRLTYAAAYLSRAKIPSLTQASVYVIRGLCKT